MRAGNLLLATLALLSLASCRNTGTTTPHDINELNQWKPRFAGEQRKIKIRGTITFSDELSNFFTIQDDTGALKISLPKGHSASPPGKLVEVTVQAGGVPALFSEASTFVLGEALPPEPFPLRLQDKNISKRVGQRTSFDGLILSVAGPRQELAVFMVKNGEQVVPVNAVFAGANDLSTFKGAKVHITGVLMQQAHAKNSEFEIWTQLPEVQIREAVAAQPSRNKSALPVLRTALAVHRLSTAQAALEYPVELRAVVTYFDSRYNWLFVQDRTDGIFAQLGAGTEVAMQAGDLVLLKGFSLPGQFAPSVNRARASVIGRAPLPRPETDMESAFVGKQDSRFVELRGVVQSVTEVQHDVVMQLVWGKHEFQARTSAPLSQVQALVDREVIVQGACAAVFNDRRQILGIRALVPGMAFIHPKTESISDPFLLPLRMAANLLQFSPDSGIEHRIHLGGIVTLASPSGPTWIRSGNDGLKIENHEPIQINEGDAVDIVGFPDAGNYGPVLKGAIVKKRNTNTPVSATPMYASEAATGRGDSQLIQLDAKLLEELTYDGQRILRLQSGTDVFDATIPADKGFPALPPGTTLRVSGICSVVTDNARGILVARGFHLSLRSAADVIVLEEAPWFNMRRLGFLLAGTLVVVTAGLFWIVLLRRNVRSQTRMLTAKGAQLEEAHALATSALDRAREAESLEQSRRHLMGLVANDELLELILHQIARAAEKHAPGTVCFLQISGSAGTPILMSSPSTPELTDSSQSNRRHAVSLQAEGAHVGSMVMVATAELDLTEQQKSIFASWAQFVTLAIKRRGFYEKLSFRAQFDSLTGLHNRASFYERFSAEVAAAQREGTRFGVLYIDLNGFKSINDTYGHDTGDLILRETANRIRNSVRHCDLVARVGGDEFVVLLSDVPGVPEAERVAAQLRADLNQPVQLASRSFAFGASLGLAVFPRDGETADMLLKKADQNMYQEKTAMKRSRHVELSGVAV